MDKTHGLDRSTVEQCNQQIMLYNINASIQAANSSATLSNS